MWVKPSASDMAWMKGQLAAGRIRAMIDRTYVPLHSGSGGFCCERGRTCAREDRGIDSITRGPGGAVGEGREMLTRSFNREVFRVLLFGMLLAGPVLFAQAAGAEHRVTETMEHYTIAGSDPKDLREQMDRLGTRGVDGKTFDANTSSRIRWDFTYHTSSDDCRIGSVLVLLEIRYLLPKWEGHASAPRTSQEAWDSYIEKLAAHERTHGDLARRAAADLEVALQNLPGKRYCEEVGKAANDLASNAVKDLQRQDAEYDERTKHGYTEGAIFPQ